MPLPSKKISIFLVSTVVVVSGVISYNSYKERKAVEHKIAAGDTTERIITISRETGEKSVDSDSDGLQDWEETLWGTNIFNPDSDGDGTNDKEEIDSSRNPLQAGPDDEIKASATNGEPILYDNVVPGTLTDNLSINLAANYFNLKQNGTFTQETSDELVSQIVSDISKITTLENSHYTSANVKSHSKSSAVDKSYGELLATAQVNLINTVATYKDLEPELYLTTVSGIYRSTAERLSTFSVPRELVDSHVQIMNNYYNIGIVFDDMKNYQTDPVRSLLAIRSYQEMEARQTESYTKIANYFIENDIIFDNSNAGKIWNTY